MSKNKDAILNNSTDEIRYSGEIQCQQKQEALLLESL